MQASQDITLKHISHKCYLNMFEGVHSWCWCKSYKFFASGGVNFKASKSSVVRVGSSCLSPFNSLQARTGKLLSGIRTRRKQWIISKGEGIRPEPVGSWSKCCNFERHVAICCSASMSKASAGLGTMLPCLMCWSMKRSMCLRALELYAEIAFDNVWDRINRFDRFEMCLRSF